MRLIEKKYLEAYSEIIGKEIKNLIENFNFSEENGSFEYLTKSSAVYSSNIEGNSLDLNSYMNYELNKSKFKPDKEIEEIEDLIKAYEFAQNNELNERNFLNSHKLLSATILIKSKRGKYREEQIGVFSKSGFVYMAVEHEFVEREMNQVFEDITSLLKSDLNEMEVFYFASLLHLIFVHIHPFNDGNGRTARLIEKWFIAEKLGQKFWKIPSEEYYKNNRAKYYEYINIGVNYYTLNYDKCLNFLQILPNSLRQV